MHFDAMTTYCNYVEGPVTMQGWVDSNLLVTREFTLVQQWKEQLRIISDTIKYVHYKEAIYRES